MLMTLPVHLYITNEMKRHTLAMGFGVCFYQGGVGWKWDRWRTVQFVQGFRNDGPTKGRAWAALVINGNGEFSFFYDEGGPFS
jgi:hypothetical protein